MSVNYVFEAQATVFAGCQKPGASFPDARKTKSPQRQRSGSYEALLRRHVGERAVMTCRGRAVLKTGRSIERGLTPSSVGGSTTASRSTPATTRRATIRKSTPTATSSSTPASSTIVRETSTSSAACLAVSAGLRVVETDRATIDGDTVARCGRATLGDGSLGGIERTELDVTESFRSAGLVVGRETNRGDAVDRSGSGQRLREC